MEGIINLIGFLGASEKPQPGLLDALNHICTIRGIYVGSRSMLQDMVRAFESNNIHPVIDPQVFQFEQGKEAFEYLVWCQRCEHTDLCLLYSRTGRPETLRQSRRSIQSQ